MNYLTENLPGYEAIEMSTYQCLKLTECRVIVMLNYQGDLLSGCCIIENRGSGFRNHRYDEISKCQFRIDLTGNIKS